MFFSDSVFSKVPLLVLSAPTGQRVLTCCIHWPKGTSLREGGVKQREEGTIQSKVFPYRLKWALFYFACGTFVSKQKERCRRYFLLCKGMHGICCLSHLLAPLLSRPLRGIISGIHSSFGPLPKGEGRSETEQGEDGHGAELRHGGSQKGSDVATAS